MIGTLLKQASLHSPAFVLDMGQVKANLRPLDAIRQATDCSVLYSMKALPLAELLKNLKTQLDGISVSSLWEARLAREIFDETYGVHLTSPGLRPDEFDQLSQICSHISFNSLSQYSQLQGLTEAKYSSGLRINPKQSFATDVRYDPCRISSKLGADIGLLQHGLPQGTQGLHLHTVFGQTDFNPLRATIAHLLPTLKSYGRLQWLNLGGGYLFHSISDLGPLIELIQQLKTEYVDQVYLEPGKAIVGNAGYLLTTVLDRFESDDKTVLILDTSVNHHPKVFEYQIKPVLLQEDIDGSQKAILAGCSCLAGDLFGEYCFKTVPKIGDRLVFADVGAYSLIKANRFNGYPLPTLYSLHEQTLALIKKDEYADYHRQWG